MWYVVHIPITLDYRVISVFMFDYDTAGSIDTIIQHALIVLEQ